ncbi:hypothetical protein L211DRAFT_590035 [Terfezia boudieri ATCC MYA-4762]|uniref:Uncharacterized protein n=1 Tax=Terfezia boudieri ATCC MYA-4762 TaxID=1051890 RepID=A0A3N4LA98_9PEZI|nr:hypothetical protein L211DRAFT_590035 [Terfezia boudieri ATCC MYA-4762]
MTVLIQMKRSCVLRARTFSLVLLCRLLTYLSPLSPLLLAPRTLSLSLLCSTTVCPSFSLVNPSLFLLCSSTPCFWLPTTV